MDWFNYVVSFSDHRAKTGVTSKPFHRLQDFIDDANALYGRLEDALRAPPVVTPPTPVVEPRPTKRPPRTPRTTPTPPAPTEDRLPVYNEAEVPTG